jgi:small multidrug resistance pump
VDLGDFVAWLALFGAIALEVIATVSLKTADGFTRFWPSVVVVVGYVGCFTLLGYALKTFDVALVYAIWSAIGTAAITIIGVMLFGESITLPRVSGVVLIVIGVVVLNLSGGEAHGAGSAPKASPGEAGDTADAQDLVTAGAQPVPAPRRPDPESEEVALLMPHNGLIPRQARPRHDMRTDPDSELRPIFPDLRRPEG